MHWFALISSRSRRLCLDAITIASFIYFFSPAAVLGQSVTYPGGASPDSATIGEIIDLAVPVSNVGSEALADIWIKLDIYNGAGRKIESSHGDYSDGLIYWNNQGQPIPAYAVVTFTARYYLGISSSGTLLWPGTYSLKYAAWIHQPGSPGAAQIGELQTELFSVGPISAPTVTVPILMYHRVDDQAPDEYWVLASEFEGQMKVLNAYGYEAIKTEDIYDYNYLDGVLPQKPVIITFDDGYENLYTHAYPILMQEGLFGEAYVITDYVGFSALSRRYTSLLSRGPLVYPHLTWPEIIEMAANGMVIGSHTETHRQLTTLSESEIETELSGSKQAILDYAGISATSFSYPFGDGDGNPTINQLLARSGYSTAVSAWLGLEHTTSAPPLDLKRVYIYGPNHLEDPTCSGVSVDYDPIHPADFFMTQLDPDFPVPLISVETVEILDEQGIPRDMFARSEIVRIRIQARNTGPANNVVLSLQLDDDAGAEPVQYDSHLQSQDISLFFETTTGSAQVFEFLWQVPPGAPPGMYDYSLDFHDQTCTLGFASTGFVADKFAVCGNIHLLQPANGAAFKTPPTFVWEPGCNDSFIVEFSYSPAFPSPRRTPILSTTSFTIPQSIWRGVPYYRNIYWRVLGVDGSIQPLQVNETSEVRFFRRSF